MKSTSEFDQLNRAVWIKVQHSHLGGVEIMAPQHISQFKGVQERES